MVSSISRTDGNTPCTQHRVSNVFDVLRGVHVYLKRAEVSENLPTPHSPASQLPPPAARHFKEQNQEKEAAEKAATQLTSQNQLKNSSYLIIGVH